METVHQELLQMITSSICRHGLLPMGLVLQFFGFEWGRKNEWKFIYSTSKYKKSTQSLACSQCLIHTVYTCKLLQAKSYNRTLIPIKYKQRLPTHPFPKVLLQVVVKCRNIYRDTNNDNRKKNHTHTHTQSNYGNVNFTQHTLSFEDWSIALQVPLSHAWKGWLWLL